MTQPQTDYDSAWKEVLERYFEEFISFFFPEAYAGIDWAMGYEFLDKELQQVVRDAELGRRLADKLVKVWSRDGEEAWVLVHVEVQGHVDREFAKRMYVYNYRLFDRYDRKVVTLAVLADTHPTWRPGGFGYNLWGCRVRIEFPAVKLLDYDAQWSELEQSINPFAVIVMTHLKTQATYRDAEGRLHWKLTLVKMLYHRGYTREDILELFRFIDWLMVLPEDIESSFTEALKQYEEDMKMPYVTSVERRGIQKGIQKGIQQGIEKGIEKGIETGIKKGIRQGLLQNSRESIIEILEARFEIVPSSISKNISAMEDLSLLKMLLKKAATVDSLQKFKEILEKMLQNRE
ncbi:hypothetical protein [Desulforhabdus amnigena]|uniref:Transposase n=1 Tax=Desulforhabdus amnigena TaxID=40218 RepID=A0A9W6FX78_9BACT|nr:hypothetical protein [Desulforhabdus amnigena]NLJ28678.1 transposase [Deltaproteobacteria bacterium]GLI36473.1 hypothetical protein DAMNIGENAA_39060 [Desulforhabdus amnigena]